MRKRDSVGLAGAAGLLAAAIIKERRLPPAERQGHGHVCGMVPYDLRKPTWERVEDRLWNPDAPLMTPHVFGVGWTVNVGRLLGLLGVAVPRRTRTP
ncbi:MAG: DUF5808 domain-containing protein [Nocardioidaceae bacterium]